MSEEGKNILKMIQETRKLCEQISLLLQTVDEQMRKKEWQAISNYVMSERSKNLFEPKKWLPHELFRFYTHNEYENILIFVSVLLDNDVDKEYEEKIIEPLLTAGYFDYGPGKKVDDKWEYWYSRWHGYMKNRKDDGTICESKKNWQEDWGETGEYPFQSYMCFGIPLTSIINAQDIDSKIVKPLIDHIPR